jgi:hypothetical protein
MTDTLISGIFSSSDTSGELSYLNFAMYWAAERGLRGLSFSKVGTGVPIGPSRFHSCPSSHTMSRTVKAMIPKRILSRSVISTTTRPCLMSLSRYTVPRGPDLDMLILGGKPTPNNRHVDTNGNSGIFQSECMPYDLVNSIKSGNSAVGKERLSDSR